MRDRLKDFQSRYGNKLFSIEAVDDVRILTAYYFGVSLGSCPICFEEYYKKLLLLDVSKL